ncbi:UDP-glucose flavonoid 3-O-glucosyltransferase 7-like [Ziziphus jujuba]|uniref:Glycosyltransferase n=1 Tax=Ziziphus jujuba TaxID=326968 RepID=A0A6P3YU64_ZIZJJ|nr:UDP-glucose flavonoid 3-O-glucosyltransferase 7-like [Ziziphus jujuba]
MESGTLDELRIFFFPFMAQGHIIPTIDMAMVFASRGSKATIITTPFHAPLFSKTIQKTNFSGTHINILTFKFPSVENGLPEGCESLHMANSPELQPKFFKAITTLGPQLDQLLEQHRPDCLVADTFFPWATDIAARYEIPRLIFHGTCYFSLCASLCVFRYKPYKSVFSETEPFIIPNLPGEIKFTRNQLPDFVKNDEETEFTEVYKAAKEVESRSYGVLVNSFYELEPVYADHYSKGLGFKAWHIGPLFLYKKVFEEKAKREMEESSLDEHECLKWLSSKKRNSVVYICFGSLTDFIDAQLMEIAAGLEASGKEFIWVVKKGKNEGVKEEWLPEGYEKRMEGKGLIVRGWAPQVQILDHEAVGGFVTHCGWNSTMEGICAGVPVVAWPVSAEQFYNEKLVTQILGIGVCVGNQKWARLVGDFVKRETIAKAVNQIMEGEEAEKMRSKVKALGDMARRAIEEGGSSYLDFNAFIEELKLRRMERNSS